MRDACVDGMKTRVWTQRHSHALAHGATLPRPRSAVQNRRALPQHIMPASLSPNITSVQRALPRAVLLAALLLLSGCGSLGYYLQAAAGQFEIWQRQRSIEQLLAAHDTPAPLRAKLELVERARHFAAARLALPDHGSYHSYADLGRDYVVWNVFAAPELSLTPLTTCYPLIGCLDYRGFFSPARAHLHAATLEVRGYDTFVGGVAAYSTLGWLNDPVLNTVLRRRDIHLVDIIFHELSHQRLYIAGDTTFNESFAMAVARAGVALWLADDATALARYRAEQAREAAFIALVRDYSQRLASAYAAPVSDARKRADKDALFSALHARYLELKAQWGGDDAYDAWMDSDLNNAKLASLAAYHDEVDYFLNLLARCEQDFPRFYGVVERLGKLAPARRLQCLHSLGGSVAPNADCAAALCDAALCD